jgi:hypothetical protein
LEAGKARRTDIWQYRKEGKEVSVRIRGGKLNVLSLREVRSETHSTEREGGKKRGGEEGERDRPLCMRRWEVCETSLNPLRHWWRLW